MSNTTELINAINKAGTEDGDAVHFVGAAVGAVADYAGFVGAIIGAINFLESLLVQDDQSKVALVDVLNSIRDDLKAESLLQRLRDLDSVIAPAEGVFAQLKATLNAINAGKPPSEDEILDQIRTCLTAVISLGPAVGQQDKWTAVYNDQVYFPLPKPENWAYEGGGIPSAVFPRTPSNPGPGQPFTYKGLTFMYFCVPTADGNGLVFNYTYILPLFLRALMIFLAVGALLDPKFTENYSEQLRSIADFLLTQHDKIQKEGIVNLWPPNADDAIVPLNKDVALTDQLQSGLFIDTRWDGATSPSPVPDSIFGWTGSPPLFPNYPLGPDFRQSYGAVSLFSGYSSAGAYPPLDIPPDLKNNPYPGVIQRPADDWFLGFFSKYLLRTLKRSKDVYRGIGLPAVRKTINRLRSLVGEAPLPGPSFGDWSLREAFTVLGYPENHLIAPPLSLAPLTVGNLATFIANSAPTLSSRPTSLRAMLDAS
jgi:hypothetical protein